MLQRRARLDPLPRRQLGAARCATTPTGWRRSSSASFPWGRLGTVDEIADVVTFLVSPRASWVVGACVVGRRRPVPLVLSRRPAPRTKMRAGTATTLETWRSPAGSRRRFEERIRELEEHALSPLAVRSYETRGRERARGAVRRADAVPARSRPDRPLEAVPAAEGQDAGLHRPGGRPLPHADDPHARDDRDLARRRARAAAERGSRRGDRARSRHRATRRSGTRASRRSTRRSARAFGGRFRHNEQSCRIARRLNLTHEVCDGILTHTGAQEPETLEGKIVRIVDRVAYINHDIDDAIRYGILTETRPPARRDRAARRRRARSGSTRSSTTSSRRRSAAGDIAPERRDRRGDALAARLHVRARLPRPARRARARARARRRAARSSTRSSTIRSCSRRATGSSRSGSPTTSRA